MKDAGEKDGGRRGESERNKDRGEGGERRDKQKVVFSSEWEVWEREKKRGGEENERERGITDGEKPTESGNEKREMRE